MIATRFAHVRAGNLYYSSTAWRPANRIRVLRSRGSRTGSIASVVLEVR